jgi:hypothetical protein
MPARDWDYKYSGFSPGFALYSWQIPLIHTGTVVFPDRSIGIKGMVPNNHKSFVGSYWHINWNLIREHRVSCFKTFYTVSTTFFAIILEEWWQGSFRKNIFTTSSVYFGRLKKLGSNSSLYSSVLSSSLWLISEGYIKRNCNLALLQ